MNGNSSLKALLRKLPKAQAAPGKDPRMIVRAVLGVLLVANVAWALVLFKPWGPTPEELEQQLGQLRSQIRQKKTSVERLDVLVGKSRKAREEGDEFMHGYFMDRRTASSTILAELKDAAKEAGIEQQEHSFSYEPIEGSDNLQMMTISGNYEGQYRDLVRFINLLDRSPRFLILDTLTAAPERTAGGLKMNFKINVFVIDHGWPVEAPGATEPSSEPGAAILEKGGPADVAASEPGASPAAPATDAPSEKSPAGAAAEPAGGQPAPAVIEGGGPPTPPPPGAPGGRRAAPSGSAPTAGGAGLRRTRPGEVKPK